LLGFLDVISCGFAAPNDNPRRVRLKFDPLEEHWSAEDSLAIRVYFVGAVAVEGRVLSVAQANPGAPAQGFGIIISELPKEADVDVQLIYASRSSYALYVSENEPIPPVSVTRIAFGGKAKEQKKDSGPLQLGQITNFP
jgi:hypothetical protein